MMKIAGLKEFESKLKNLSARAKKLDGTHDVPVSELLTADFLRQCSRFNSADELFRNSGFSIESAADFKAIPDDQWDIFIRDNTTYGDWKEMLSAASKSWVKGQLVL